MTLTVTSSLYPLGQGGPHTHRLTEDVTHTKDAARDTPHARLPEVHVQWPCHPRRVGGSPAGVLLGSLSPLPGPWRVSRKWRWDPRSSCLPRSCASRLRHRASAGRSALQVQPSNHRDVLGAVQSRTRFEREQTLRQNRKGVGGVQATRGAMCQVRRVSKVWVESP